MGPECLVMAILYLLGIFSPARDICIFHVFASFSLNREVKESWHKGRAGHTLRHLWSRRILSTITCGVAVKAMLYTITNIKKHLDRYVLHDCIACDSINSNSYGLSPPSPICE